MDEMACMNQMQNQFMLNAQVEKPRKGRKKKIPDVACLQNGFGNGHGGNGPSSLSNHPMGMNQLHSQGFYMEMPPQYPNACNGLAQQYIPEFSLYNTGGMPMESSVMQGFSHDVNQYEYEHASMAMMAELFQGNILAENYPVPQARGRLGSSFSNSPQQGTSLADSGLDRMQSPLMGPGSNVSQTQSPMGEGPSSAYSSGGMSLSSPAEPGSTGSNAGYSNSPRGGPVFSVPRNGSQSMSPPDSVYVRPSPSDSNYSVAHPSQICGDMAASASILIPPGHQRGSGGSVMSPVRRNPLHMKAMLHQRALQHIPSSAMSNASNNESVIPSHPELNGIHQAPPANSDNLQRNSFAHFQNNGALQGLCQMPSSHCIAGDIGSSAIRESYVALPQYQTTQQQNVAPSKDSTDLPNSAEQIEQYLSEIESLA